MINYGKRPWTPLALILGWFAWLFAMGSIAKAGLSLIGGELWFQIIWVFVIITVTFVLPFFLFRRFSRSRSIGQKAE